MMQCLQAKLGIDAGAHRLGRSDQEADLAGPNVAEQPLFCLRLLVVLHIGDFRSGHAEPDQFIANPAIGRNAPRVFSTLIVQRSEKVIWAAPVSSNGLLSGRK